VIGRAAHRATRGGGPLLGALLFALGAMQALAITPDAAREQRWAEEIVPQLVVGDAVWLATAHNPRVLALYAKPAAPTRNAVIVVHGQGVHPDWGLIGVLRSDLADMGFATLSVQMPVLAANAAREDYPSIFPDAFERLDAALAFMRAHGYAHVVVVSHSLGAAMVDAWLAHSQPSLDAWVPVGLTVDFARPPRVPVLDVVAERDLPDALRAAKMRAARLPHDACSSSVVVAGTDHYFDHAAGELARRIAPFLSLAFAGKC
jgi:uncharacterized protein DUF3530